MYEELALGASTMKVTFFGRVRPKTDEDEGMARKRFVACIHGG